MLGRARKSKKRRVYGVSESETKIHGQRQIWSIGVLGRFRILNSDDTAKISKCKTAFHFRILNIKKGAVKLPFWFYKVSFKICFFFPFLPKKKTESPDCTPLATINGTSLSLSFNTSL